MKLDRLIGIITTLQQQGKVTAPYLAEKFEVSRRTISRDIEAICQAGIPIVTEQGSGGGICLMPGFALDTTVFTEGELSAVLTGLQSLDSVSRTSRAQRLTEKLGGAGVSDGTISIDLASFYKDSLAEKIECLQKAIRDCRSVTFRYYSPKGDEMRCIDPCRVVYRWSGWYVQGFCHERQDFRLFKLLRLWELTVTEEGFTPRPIPEEKQRLGTHMTDDYMITAIYDASCKYRLVEEYGPDSFTMLPDGRVHTRWGFTSKEEAVRWFLSFGDRVTVTDPPEMAARMRDAAARILSKYPET